MFKRQLLRAAVALGIAVVAVFATASAADAAPSSFYTASVHGGGTGSIGAAFQGGLLWSNRSVTLNTPRLYVASGECATIEVYAWQGETLLDYYTPNRSYCPAGAGEWYRFSDIPLEGDIPGGVTEVAIFVDDLTHNGVGETDCLRAATMCF